MKHFVDFGVYVIKGSINCQLAEKTRFSDEDAEKIKEALKTLFYIAMHYFTFNSTKILFPLLLYMDKCPLTTAKYKML